MQKPPLLKKGDSVAIVSPAGRIAPEKIDNAVSWFSSWGLQVRLGKYAKNEYFKYAGTDNQRLSDLQAALDDPEIKAVFCSRGGYGIIRILDKLNVSGLIKNPKWLIGFSDVTFLHALINNNFSICSLHGPMPGNFPLFSDGNTDSMQYLQKALFEGALLYTIPPVKKNIKGSASGILCGGNLSALTMLNGSSSDFDPDGKILFIEEIDEYLYHIDRMLWALERSHDLSNLAGVICGHFSDIHDNDTPFGQNLEEIVLDHFSAFGFPVCLHFPAGHELPNYSLFLNTFTSLDVQADKVIISQ
jgi:muramoyltetrapeptide carboxypeptidase